MSAIVAESVFQRKPKNSIRFFSETEGYWLSQLPALNNVLIIYYPTKNTNIKLPNCLNR